MFTTPAAVAGELSLSVENVNQKSETKITTSLSRSDSQ